MPTSWSKFKPSLRGQSYDGFERNSMGSDGTSRLNQSINEDDEYLLTGDQNGYSDEMPRRKSDKARKEQALFGSGDDTRWSQAWEDEKATLQMGLKLTIEVRRKHMTEPFGMRLARTDFGAVVRDLVENSTSERSGVLRGDILVAVNGVEFPRSVEGHDQALAVFRDAGLALVMVIERPNEKTANLDVRFSKEAAASPDLDENGNYRVPITIIRDATKKGEACTAVLSTLLGGRNTSCQHSSTQPLSAG